MRVGPQRRLSTKKLMFSHCVLEKTLESPLESKIKSVNAKGNQPWIFIGRTDPKAEAPILWPPDAKNWLIWKDPDAGKNWRQEEKGMTEDEMVGWYHQLDGHDFEQAPGVGDGQGSLVCCSLWGCRVGHDWSNLAAAADSILKNRDIAYWQRSSIQGCGFSSVMYGCESCIKKSEYQRIDAFELWCWRRLLRVPWTARKSNQSILKEISPE